MSVVIPTYNRRLSLEHVLHALAVQIVDQPFEVVVVSDGSQDDTDDFLSSGKTALPVTAVMQDNGGPAAARDAGVRDARGEIVLFIDDDVVPSPHLVAEHLHAHAEYGPDVVVIGPMLRPVDARLSPWVDWEQRMLEKQYAALAGGLDAHSRQFYTGNASVRREHVLAAGSFNPGSSAPKTWSWVIGCGPWACASSSPLAPKPGTTPSALERRGRPRTQLRPQRCRVRSRGAS